MTFFLLYLFLLIDLKNVFFSKFIYHHHSPHHPTTILKVSRLNFLTILNNFCHFSDWSFTKLIFGFLTIREIGFGETAFGKLDFGKTGIHENGFRKIGLRKNEFSEKRNSEKRILDDWIRDFGQLPTNGVNIRTWKFERV